MLLINVSALHDIYITRSNCEVSLKVDSSRPARGGSTRMVLNANLSSSIPDNLLKLRFLLKACENSSLDILTIVTFWMLFAIKFVLALFTATLDTSVAKTF